MTFEHDGVAAMLCRGCGNRFDLRETIYWSIPPGIPVRPGTSLAVVVPVVVGAIVGACLLPDQPLHLLALAAVVVLIWVWHYVFYWWLERHPHDGKALGTCPSCDRRNFVWPWSL
jgi:hypothetical protein